MNSNYFDSYNGGYSEEIVAAKSPQVVSEIVSSNRFNSSNIKPSNSGNSIAKRSYSIEVSTLLPTGGSSSSSSSSSSAYKLTHPSRKYFDSGDYELARAGILSSASVGSIHPSAEKLLAGSRDEINGHNESTPPICRNISAPNTATLLKKSTFSMASLDESDLEEDRRMIL